MRIKIQNTSESWISYYRYPTEVPYRITRWCFQLRCKQFGGNFIITNLFLIFSIVQALEVGLNQELWGIKQIIKNFYLFNALFWLFGCGSGYIKLYQCGCVYHGTNNSKSVPMKVGSAPFSSVYGLMMWRSGYVGQRYRIRIPGSGSAPKCYRTDPQNTAFFSILRAFLNFCNRFRLQQAQSMRMNNSTNNSKCVLVPMKVGSAPLSSVSGLMMWRACRAGGRLFRSSTSDSDTCIIVIFTKHNVQKRWRCEGVSSYGTCFTVAPVNFLWRISTGSFRPKMCQYFTGPPHQTGTPAPYSRSQNTMDRQDGGNTCSTCANVSEKQAKNLLNFLCQKGT